MVFDCVETSIALLWKAWYDNGRPGKGLATSAGQTNIAICTARPGIHNPSTISPLGAERALIEIVRAESEVRMNDENNATAE